MDPVINDPAEFKKVLPEQAKLDKLAGGFKFVEGPVWLGEGEAGYLVFSDIPASQLRKWTPKGVDLFRSPSNQANGNTRDLDGRLITCEHESRRVTRTEKDGKITVLAAEFEGKRLNSPNDVVVKSDGTIWFTDPPYGLGKRPKELAGNFVFRLDLMARSLTKVIADMDHPNGLCFSPNEKKLYVADSGQPRHIKAYDVSADGSTTGEGKVFAQIDIGVPDGIRCDKDGRVWSSAGDGVHIFTPGGKLTGKILTPEVADPHSPGKAQRESPANLCFGGPDGRTLFITARTSLYAICTNVTGAAR